ncbi:hypothetical protein BaRGS_00018303 [Batillaria attramentaria]|uniref:Uncharacterized protein n=1 Tax=Batillaria attramentaria TaxID=370345 RepID=A0ABD0KTG7_9CAEN
MSKMSSAVVGMFMCIISSHAFAQGDIFANNSAFYKLKSEVMKGYSPNIRPVRNISTVTNVSVTFKLSAISEISMTRQMMSQALYLSVSWTDEFINWNPGDYGGATDFLVRQKDVWVPDLAFGPQVSSTSGKLGNDDLHVRLWHNGTMIWSPHMVVESFCAVSIVKYPFDEQSCNWYLYMMSSDKRHVQLTGQMSSNVFQALIAENVEWELVTITDNLFDYQNDGLRLSAVSFTYLLRRRPGFLILTVISPTVMLSLLSILVFALPVESGEKMSLGVTLMLAFVFQLSFVTSVLPPSSLQTSILVVYLLVLCSCSSTSVLLTVAVLSLHHRPDSVPLSPSAAGFVRLLHSCGRIRLTIEKPQTPETSRRILSNTSLAHLGTEQNARQINQLHGNGGSRSRSSGRGIANVTWPDVAVACDYVFFRLFLFVICLASIICFSLMVF